jgi:hypothetical protein
MTPSATLVFTHTARFPSNHPPSAKATVIFRPGENQSRFSLGISRHARIFPGMSKNLPSSEADESLSLAITVAPAAIGCGMGLLLGGDLERRTCRVAALTLFTIGIGFAVPAVLGFVNKQINRPGTNRRAARELQGIREAGGSFSVEEYEEEIA